MTIRERRTLRRYNEKRTGHNQPLADKFTEWLFEDSIERERFWNRAVVLVVLVCAGACMLLIYSLLASGCC